MGDGGLGVEGRAVQGFGWVGGWVGCGESQHTAQALLYGVQSLVVDVTLGRSGPKTRSKGPDYPADRAVTMSHGPVLLRRDQNHGQDLRVHSPPGKRMSLNMTGEDDGGRDELAQTSNSAA